MRNWLLFVLACCGGVTAVAQTTMPVASSEDAGAMAREQLRIEIRSMLSASRNAEQSQSSADPVPALRQLSSQQRAEMREQLRRYQPQQRRLRR